jgi:hypothetical protein
MFDQLGEFDKLGCTCRRMPFDTPSLGPPISRVVVPDIAEQKARGRPMDDQANIFVYTNRPEVRIAGPVEPMEAETKTRRIQLQIKRRRLDRLLLCTGQSGEAGGEGIGDAEFHRDRRSHSEPVVGIGEPSAEHKEAHIDFTQVPARMSAVKIHKERIIFVDRTRFEFLIV